MRRRQLALVDNLVGCLSSEALETLVRNEIAAIIENPPSWYDTTADNDAAPTPMQLEQQRGRNNWARFAWRWECNVHGPAGTLYAGSSYRVLVRVPRCYPQLPPRILVLSIFSHVEVETRDPYEGQLEDSFYECLERVRAGAMELTTMPSVSACSSGSSVAGGSALSSDGGGKRALDHADAADRRAKRPKATTAADGAPSSAKTTLAHSTTSGGQREDDDEEKEWPEEERSYTVAMALAMFVKALEGPLPRWRPADAHEETDDAHEAAKDAHEAAWYRVAASHHEDAQTCAAYQSLCLHPELFQRPQPSWFAPSFAAAFAHGPPTAAAVRALVEEVSPGVFAFDFLSPSFCERLLCELEHYESSGLPVVRPNSMNRYGVVLNSIGMEKTIDALQRHYVRALAAALFPVEGEHVDHHHAFMVQYKHGEDLGLDMHTDACDVTLNVCLGKEFTGAGLTFCGLRGGGRERTFSYRHQHVKGRAIMHAGHHRHGADDILGGERYNLILWNKSSTFRASKEYMNKVARPEADEADKPDLVCLSYTHDDDYEKYRPLPAGVVPRRERCAG